MTMQIVNLIQGTPEWHQHRARHFNASDAPAMMGCSSYKTRSELIKELATGLSAEVDPATQRRFDDGHRFEALARPLAEEFIGDELSPCVGTEGKYSASFDGLTFMHDVAFEHKSLNATLRQAMAEGCSGADLPLQYQVQMEHQAMVAGTVEKVLFMASKWSGEELIEERHCWYTPNLELRAQIVAGWAQLEQDVAGYVPSAEAAAPVVAEPVESLPAVVVQVNGALAVSGNLNEFGEALRGFIANMKSKPETDQDFANAEAECKTLKKAEDALDAGEEAALASISVVEQMRRLKADLKNIARTARLAREKLVAAEKDRLRTALVTGAQAALDQYVATLNRRLGANWLPRIAGGFAETIKGKKSLANMEDAVAVALTSAKHEANQLAERLEVNRKHLVQEDGDWIALFADFATVGTKATEDFQALAALRIGKHKQDEAQRLEAQREQIRKEEAARLEREAAAAERQRIQQQAEADKAALAQAEKAGELAAPLATDLAGLVADKASETVAGIDAQQVISTAKASSTAADPGPVMTLGQVNTLLENAGQGKISAATLEHHGIPFVRERGAVQVAAPQVRRLLILLSLGMRKLAGDFTAILA